MLFVAFILKAMLISLSGVMAPGPITAVSVAEGNRSPHAGAWVAVGHGFVEFPLMIFIFLGFEYLLKSAQVKGAIGLVGGLFLLFMAYGMFRSIKSIEVSPITAFKSPIVAGVVLSLTSPYFLIWWATVGASLIIASMEFGITGFVVLAIFHWLCDFVWYYFLSALAFKSGKFFGHTFQKIIFAVCGAFLAVMGVKFVADAVKLIAG